MHLIEEIGARLQAERKRLEMTQDQFSTVVGVSKRALASYEGGTREAGVGLLSLAAAAGVDVLFVLTGMPSPCAADSLTPEESRFITLLRATAETDKAILQRTAEAFAKAGA